MARPSASGFLREPGAGPRSSTRDRAVQFDDRRTGQGDEAAQEREALRTSLYRQRRGGSSFGRSVARFSLGELLKLPFMHAGQPIAVLGRWTEPRVIGETGATQGMHIRSILFDP